jgi:hypothetical protein
MFNWLMEQAGAGNGNPLDTVTRMICTPVHRNSESLIGAPRRNRTYNLWIANQNAKYLTFHAHFDLVRNGRI